MSNPLPAPIVEPLAPSNDAGSGVFVGTMSLSTPPPTPKAVDLPSPPLSPSPPPSAPEETVRAVLSHLLLHHPNLGAPSLSDRAKFLEKAQQLPGLPEWMWYGMLHYGVVVVGGDDDCMKEVVDFGILDDLLGEGDLQGPGRLWDMTFYYMFLHLEGGRRCSAACSSPPSPHPPPPSSPPPSPPNGGEIEGEAAEPKVAPAETNKDDEEPKRQRGGPKRGKVWMALPNSLLAMAILLAMVSVVAIALPCGFLPDFRYGI